MKKYDVTFYYHTSVTVTVEAENEKEANVSADDLSNLVDDVKETVKEENITDHQTIVNIINNTTINYNINLSNNDIENLADSIEQIQNVQGDINSYQTEVSDVMNSTNDTSETDFLDGLFNQ